MSKPFNLSDAKLGHPVSTEAGSIGKLLASDIANGPLLYQFGAYVYYCNGNGLACNVRGVPMVLPLVMAPLGTVNGREVYPGDMLCHCGGNAIPVPYGIPFEPSEWGWPKPAYPVTRMDVAYLSAHWPAAESDSFQAIANAAIAHGIENGYLFAASDEYKLQALNGNHHNLCRLLEEIAIGAGMPGPTYLWKDIPAAVRMREVAIARVGFKDGYQRGANGIPADPAMGSDSHMQLLIDGVR